MASTPFERKEYDVTNKLGNYIACCCGCPCALANTQHLVLEPEEAVLTSKTLCDTNVQRRPYGELGSVDKATSCGCCIGVASGLGALTPGMNCEEALVNEIVEELKKRMKKEAGFDEFKCATPHAAHRIVPARSHTAHSHHHTGRDTVTPRALEGQGRGLGYRILYQPDCI